MQVSRWGNSLAIRLPAAVVDALGLKVGDQIEIQVAGKRVFEVAKAPGARELLARLRKFCGRLPATFKFDRLETSEHRWFLFRHRRAGVIQLGERPARRSCHDIGVRVN